MTEPDHAHPTVHPDAHPTHLNQGTDDTIEHVRTFIVMVWFAVAIYLIYAISVVELT